MLSFKAFNGLSSKGPSFLHPSFANAVCTSSIQTSTVYSGKMFILSLYFDSSLQVKNSHRDVKQTLILQKGMSSRNYMRTNHLWHLDLWKVTFSVCKAFQNCNTVQISISSHCNAARSCLNLVGVLPPGIQVKVT